MTTDTITNDHDITVTTEWISPVPGRWEGWTFECHDGCVLYDPCQFVIVYQPGPGNYVATIHPPSSEWGEPKDSLPKATLFDAKAWCANVWQARTS